MTRQPGREEILIPFTREKRAADHCVLICQILGIARTDDLAAGFVSEEPCWKRDRGTDRFQGTWRDVHDEPLDFSPPACLQLGGDDFDVPVRLKRRCRIQFSSMNAKRSCRRSAWYSFVLSFICVISVQPSGHPRLGEHWLAAFLLPAPRRIARGLITGASPPNHRWLLC
jgi:hypothetical protein